MHAFTGSHKIAGADFQYLKLFYRTKILLQGVSALSGL